MTFWWLQEDRSQAVRVFGATGELMWAHSPAPAPGTGMLPMKALSGQGYTVIDPKTWP